MSGTATASKGSSSVRDLLGDEVKVPSAAAMRPVRPVWQMAGLCVDKRELKGGDRNEVFGYCVKLECLGGMFELQFKGLDKAGFDGIAVGTEYVANGTFELSKYGARFIIASITR